MRGGGDESAWRSDSMGDGEKDEAQLLSPLALGFSIVVHVQGACAPPCEGRVCRWCRWGALINTLLILASAHISFLFVRLKSKLRWCVH